MVVLASQSGYRMDNQPYILLNRSASYLMPDWRDVPGTLLMSEGVADVHHIPVQDK